MSEKVCSKLAFCVDSVFSEGKGYGAIPCQDTKRREKCVVFLDTRSNPRCAENGKSFTIQNTRNLLVLGIKLDGGVFVDADFRKCDYMFVFQEIQKQKLEDKEVVPERVVLIELKGKTANDLLSALEQLEKSLNNQYIREMIKPYRSFYGRVAGPSMTPNLPLSKSDDKATRARILILQKKLDKKFHDLRGNLKTGRALFTERFDQMDRE